MKSQITLIVVLIFLIRTVLIGQDKEAVSLYNSALEYYKISNYDAAIDVLKKAIRKDDNFLVAYRTLINCYELKNDNKNTIKYYLLLIERSPSDYKLSYNLGLTYMANKEYANAKLHLKRALSINPYYDKAQVQLDRINEILNKTENQPTVITTIKVDRENQTYNEALRLYRSEKYASCIRTITNYVGQVYNPDFYYLQAISYQQIGKRDSAVNAYLLALDIDDYHYNSNLNLAKIYFNDQLYVKSIPHFEVLHAQRPNDSDIWRSLANVYFQTLNYNQSIEYALKYLDVYSKEGEMYILVSKAYQNLGNLKKARFYLEKSSQYLTNSDQVSKDIQGLIYDYGTKASEYSKSGEYDKAILVLEKAIEEFSDNASLHFNLGLNYLEIGNYTKATSEFKKTIDLDGSHAKAYQALGLIYFEKEEFSMAAAYYKASVESGKFDQYVYYKLGSCYFKLKRFNDALNAFLKSLEFEPDQVNFLFSTGLTLLMLKDNYRSIEYFEKILKRQPMQLEAHYHICINYIEMNLFEKCIEEAQKILLKNDQYAKAYLIMAHAYKRLGNYELSNKYQAIAVKINPTLRN